MSRLINLDDDDTQYMTFKQRLFVKNYIANGFHAGRAALAAGYKPTVDPTHLLHKPAIQRFLKKHMEKIEKEFDITFEAKAKLLWKTAQRSYGPTDEDVERAKKGDKAESLFDFQPNSVVNAVSELNKMQGHYAQKKTEEDNTVDTAKLNELVKENEKEY